jgi:hypothetical protein
MTRAKQQTKKKPQHIFSAFFIFFHFVPEKTTRTRAMMAMLKESIITNRTRGRLRFWTDSQKFVANFQFSFSWFVVECR